MLVNSSNTFQDTVNGWLEYDHFSLNIEVYIRLIIHYYPKSLLQFHIIVGNNDSLQTANTQPDTRTT